jgi:F0F1-type ATP synthase assembly protein I
MNNQNPQQNMQTNQYDFNIENTRATNMQTGANINQNPYINPNLNPLQTNQTQQAPQNGFINSDFVKGALIGAVATYLLTNKNAQESIFKLFGKGSEMFSAGIEELKERYEDAKAQMQSHNQE